MEARGSSESLAFFGTLFSPEDIRCRSTWPVLQKNMRFPRIFSGEVEVARNIHFIQVERKKKG